MTPRDPIKLQDAPARFLKTDWLRLVELKGSETNAIAALTRPDPGMLVYYRRLVIAEGRGSIKAQVAEDIYALVQKMIADFRTLGATGQIIGGGMYFGTGQRQTIPRELWPALVFDFAANKASGDGFSYGHVTTEQGDPASDPAEVVSKIIAWLKRNRSEKGEEPKKILAAGARVEFGSNYTERAFNAAFKQVYQRRRGRPRGSENKQNER